MVFLSTSTIHYRLLKVRFFGGGEEFQFWYGEMASNPFLPPPQHGQKIMYSMTRKSVCFYFWYLILFFLSRGGGGVSVAKKKKHLRQTSPCKEVIANVFESYASKTLNVTFIDINKHYLYRSDTTRRILTL